MQTMKMKLAKTLLVLLILFPIYTFSQKGKDLDYTVPSSNTVVNTYTYLTVDVTAPSSTITVNNNTMPGGAFLNNLAAGDLIMIIQMQGASMDISTELVVSAGGNYTKPYAYVWDFNWLQDITKIAEWGKVIAYNNSGKYEQREVASVSGSNTITLNCPLLNNYTASGHVQIVRIPRFNNLTVATSTSIVPAAWNGNTGGVVALEVNGNIILNSNSKISANGRGFRGGVANNVGNPGVCYAHANGGGNGDRHLGTFDTADGARKGEGIGGYTTEYTALYSSHGRGGPANGGGGGGHQNCGGGGGANIGAGTYTGKGVPTTTYPNAVWNLELAGFGGSSSPGGGRGGYANSNSNQDATAVGPNNTLWCNAGSSDARKDNGGFGGHQLLYDATRLFMGGGGGAGDQDQNQGGSGGAGGGIVYITCYGTISGAGTIESEGALGITTNPLGISTSPLFSSSNKTGNDGAGGGGAGGSVYIKNSSAIPATIGILVRGGNGGNHNLVLGNGGTSEASGPGGGGGGGNITITSGTPVQTLTGGISGTSNSAQITEFIVNGATNGAAGVVNPASSIFNYTASNVTICQGSNPTLTAVVIGVLPGTLSWYSVPFGGSVLGTGLTYAIPLPLLAPGVYTYYVGVCPGTFRVPVTVTINPRPIISGVAILTNPTCSNAGSITNLTVSGGTPGYTYSWNGTITAGANYTNIPAGTYTLTVTDLNGCTDTDGPHTLIGTAGPIINASGVVIQDQNCNGTLGSITGITATGTGLTYSWSNSGGSALNASNLVAGNYTLTVTDGNGCVATAGPYTVNNIPGPTVNAAGIVISPATCGNANGGISGITAAGTGLTYAWNGTASASTSLINQMGGNYTLVVTDVNGCTISSGPHFIPSTAGPTINAGSVLLSDENCNQGNGSISGLTISGGAPTYILSWTNTAQSTLNLTNLSSGSYTLTVTDQNNCVAVSGPYTILNTGAPVIDASAVTIFDEICNGTLGSITGIIATGTNLSYSWSNSGGNNLNALNLTAGSYTLTITDFNGCSALSGPYTINNNAGPTVDISSIIIVPSTCGNANGSISGIQTTGNSLTFEWNGVASGVSSLSNQLGGNYTLVVTDNVGCTASTGPITIPSLLGPTISSVGISVVNENCGQANGSITGLTIVGGSPTYNISWSNTSQSSIDITSLATGDYTLTVTDANGCNATSGPYTIANLAGPVLSISGVLIQNENCSGTLGSITGITAVGSGLNYLWSNGGGSSLDATNLIAGSYSLLVTDDGGCFATAGPFLVDYIAGPSVDASGIIITPESCGNANGAISGITSSGSSLSFEWNGIEGPNVNISGQVSGDYTLVVTDGNGCSITSGPYTIPSISGPTISELTLTINPASCNVSDGSISGLVISGGSPGYTIAWSATTQTSLDLNALAAGSYSLTVTDLNGCVANAGPYVVSSAGGLSLDETNVVVTNVMCDGTLGSITGITSNGTGLTYSWSNGVGNAIDASNLPAGSYTLTVTDGSGCTFVSGIYDVAPLIPMDLNLDDILVTQTSCTLNTGSFTGAILSGGVNASVLWSNGATTLDLYNLPFGTYTITASDDQGCSESFTIYITQTNAPMIDLSLMVVTDEHCGQSDASISGITAVAGAQPYTYEWNGDPLLNTVNLNGIPTGSYTLTVTDLQGCFDAQTVTVAGTSIPTIDISNMIVDQITCLSLGAISGIIVNGSQPIEYSWTNTSQTTLDLTNLNSGSYSLTVTDAFGCINTYGTVDLVDPIGPTADFTWNPSLPGINENVLFTNTSIGSSLTPTWTILSEQFGTIDLQYAFPFDGEYIIDLAVVDQNGCVDTVSQVIFIYADLQIPNVITVNNDGVNEVFRIQGMKPNSNLTILNRWGNVVFNSENYQNDWNGKDSSGNDLTDGVYTYILKSPDDNKETGFVHLIR